MRIITQVEGSKYAQIPGYIMNVSNEIICSSAFGMPFGIRMHEFHSLKQDYTTELKSLCFLLALIDFQRRI